MRFDAAIQGLYGSLAALPSHAKLRTSFCAKASLIFFIAAIVLGGLSVEPAAGQWMHFEMKTADANGDYLWEEPKNWLGGQPYYWAFVELGNEASMGPVHVVVTSDAECFDMELAEAPLTEGTTLRIRSDASLTINWRAVFSKDRESWLYVDGGLYGAAGEQVIMIAGGPWGRPDLGLPSKSHIIVGPNGEMNTWFIGLNKTARHPETPGYEAATGSEIIVNGGKLVAEAGLRVSTTDLADPGRLVLRGSAVFEQYTTPGNAYSANMPQLRGVEFWAGIWEIDGGNASIHVRDIYLHGNKHFAEGQALLKLTGDGISTIHVAATADLADATLDVSGLDLAGPGTFTVIDAGSFIGTNISFADGTDLDQWSFEIDQPRGELLLTYTPPCDLVADIAPVGAPDGIVDGADLGALLARWKDTGVSLADIAPVGNPDGIVDGADLGALLTRWKNTCDTGASPAIPEPATLTMLAFGAVALLSRRVEQ